MGDYCASLCSCQRCEREPLQVRATWSAAIYFYLIPAQWTRPNELITGVTATDGGGFCLFNQRVCFINSCWDYEQGEKWLEDARADLD